MSAESARGSAIELVGPYHWRIRSLERALDMLDAAAELARAQGLRVQWPEGVEPWRVVARHAPRALRVQVALDHAAHSRAPVGS